MRTFLRIAALLIALGVTVFWLFGGPNLGWTKNRVAHKEKDPVTEIEVDRYEERFVPGIDFLASGLAAAAVVAGVSFFLRRPANANAN